MESNIKSAKTKVITNLNCMGLIAQSLDVKETLRLGSLNSGTRGISRYGFFQNFRGVKVDINVN